MRSTTATDSKPRPRSRRTRIATLLAILALGTAGQALAPAGAAAVVNQPTETLCGLIGGSWLSGGCFIEDGSGGTIRVNEISVGAGRDPAPGPACVFCNLPQQIGDGAGRGGEVAKPDPKRGLGVRPEASGARRSPRTRREKVNEKCADALQLLKTLKDTLRIPDQRLAQLSEQRDQNIPYNKKEEESMARWKKSLEGARAKAESSYKTSGCYFWTGHSLPSR